MERNFEQEIMTKMEQKCERGYALPSLLSPSSSDERSEEKYATRDLFYEKGMTMNRIINGILRLIMKNNDER